MPVNLYAIRGIMSPGESSMLAGQSLDNWKVILLSINEKDCVLFCKILVTGTGNGQSYCK